MKNNTMPTEGKYSEKTLDLEGVPDTACCASHSLVGGLDGDKLRANRNRTVVILRGDGSLVQLTPDTDKSLMGGWEVEFYEGQGESPEDFRLVWDKAKLNSLLSSPYGIEMLRDLDLNQLKC